jgi:glycosyltransferase 2 family protein
VSRHSAPLAPLAEHVRSRLASLHSLARSAATARVRLALRLAGFAVSVGLVAWVAKSALSGAHLDRDDLGLIGLSMVPGLVSWLCLGRAWAALTGSASARQAMGSWARTQALRYLPGGLWGTAARAATVDGATTTKASTVAVEAALTVGVGAAIGGIAMATGGNPWWAALVVVAVVTPVALHLAGRRNPIPTSRVLRALGWYILSWVTFAVSVGLAQAAVGPLHQPLVVAGAGALARVAGIVVLFAPGGIGVREAAYVALVGSYVPTSQAAEGSLLSRMVLIAVELAVLVVVGLPVLHSASSRSALNRSAPREEPVASGPPVVSQGVPSLCRDDDAELVDG